MTGVPIGNLDTVRKALPVPQRSSRRASLQPSEEVFIQVLREDLGHTSPGNDETEDSADREGVRIVRMLPMNGKQIKLFAEQSGVNDAAGFLEEIDREDALTFAQRPLDLRDLITAWTNSGCFGTRERAARGEYRGQIEGRP